MINIVWDMETGDPDDFFTLLMLCDHPQVNLKAVTVTPGTPDQIGLVRRALSWFDLDIPVGAFNIHHGKQTVSKWYYNTYGEVEPSTDAEPAHEILLDMCDENTTLLTGAPLKNLGRAIEQGDFKVGRWVAQGGFAGKGVIPPEKQMAKFKGMTTCPTYNLNGDPRSAVAALAYTGIGIRRFVSKNVCHRVYYDREMHQIFADMKDTRKSLELVWKGMDAYLRKTPEGKKFHDPLAACCAIDESIATWAEVELFRGGGGWGSRLSPGSNTWIITDYDREKFVDVLIGTFQ